MSVKSGVARSTRLVLFVMLGTAALIVAAAPAAAKQCVWNNGGFVLRVDWFNPGTISSTVNPVDGYQEMTFAEQPVQTDVIWAPSGQCIDRGPTQYWAILSACGGSFPMRVVRYPSDWPETNRLDCAMFGMQIPSLTRYFDVWGAVWDPDFGDGGPI